MPLNTKKKIHNVSLKDCKENVLRNVHSVRVKDCEENLISTPVLT